jgi:hypothetical protein
VTRHETISLSFHIDLAGMVWYGMVHFQTCGVDANLIFFLSVGAVIADTTDPQASRYKYHPLTCTNPKSGPLNACMHIMGDSKFSRHSDRSRF